MTAKLNVQLNVHVRNIFDILNGIILGLWYASATCVIFQSIGAPWCKERYLPKQLEGLLMEGIHLQLGSGAKSGACPVEVAAPLLVKTHKKASLQHLDKKA